MAGALIELGWNTKEYDDWRKIQPGEWDIVVIDDNDIAKADVQALTRRAFVVNLAARGDGRWYANVSFMHTTHLEGTCPPDAEPAIWSGPEYQSVRREFRQARMLRKPPNSPPRRIFVSHGGSDPMGHTELTLKALSEIAGDQVIDVVLGGDFNRKLDQSLCTGATLIHRDISASLMAALMVEADLGICSMAATTYEACCVGLPTINVCRHEFHEGVAEKCQAKGFLRWVRPQVNLLAQAIQDFGNDEFQLRLTSRNAMAYVTGRGAETVAKMITDFTRDSDDLFPRD